MKRIVRFAAGLGLAALSTSALASVDQIPGGPCTLDGDRGLTERDIYRIEHLTSARTGGIAAALGAESAEDRATVSNIFSGGLYPIAAMPEGTYKCRTIKLGGMSDLVVYQWFKCEVSSGNGVLTLRKVTGSQNFTGTLEPAGSGLLFKGALSYGYETTAKRYGDDPERDQVGCVTKDFEDGTSFVLELPYPVFESLHDVIELRRE
jgi:hypothetical protein